MEKILALQKLTPDALQAAEGESTLSVTCAGNSCTSEGCSGIITITIA